MMILENKELKKVIIFYLIFLCVGFSLAVNEIEKGPIHYEIGVHAQLVPIYAVDSKGNPIYDLKEDELELYVNGKPFKVISFTNYTFEGNERRDGERKKNQYAQERLNFIIIDALNNSPSGLRRSKKIAKGIIEAGVSGDAFIVLTNHYITGIQYVIGPEKSKRKLLQAVDDVFLFRVWERMSSKCFNRLYHSRDIKEFESQLCIISKKEAWNARQSYREKLKHFALGMSQLQYALVTIPQPKIAYLISSGIPPAAWWGTGKIEYYRFLKEAVIAVNCGGSMLYLINPLKNRLKSMNSLRYMAKIGGGKYFGGSDIEKIVKLVKKNTAAYYELAFSPSPDMGVGNKLLIKVKCKRKGVKLSTIRHSQQRVSYTAMSPIQKKIFALNVINNGSWSRKFGRVQKVFFVPSQKAANNHHCIKEVEVLIPEMMRNLPVELFIINVDPNTLKADIKLVKKVVKGTEKIKIRTEKGKTQHIVIVEPINAYCIYGRV